MGELLSGEDMTHMITHYNYVLDFNNTVSYSDLSPRERGFRVKGLYTVIIII